MTPSRAPSAWRAADDIASAGPTASSLHWLASPPPLVGSLNHHLWWDTFSTTSCPEPQPVCRKPRCSYACRDDLVVPRAIAVGGSKPCILFESEALAWCVACRCVLLARALRARRGSPACATSLPSNGRLPRLPSPSNPPSVQHVSPRSSAVASLPAELAALSGLSL